jgi:hypothetical protein
MAKRYLVTSVIITIVSLATAGLAYAAGSKLTYTAFCTAKVFVRAPATAQPAATPDFLTFTNSLAANEIALATPTVYQRLAQSEHVSAGAISGTILITPAPGIGAFRATVTDTNFSRTKRIAGSACAAFVSVITKQRTNEISGDEKVVQGRLSSIQAEVQRLATIPAKKRTRSEQVSLLVQETALTFNSALLASYKSIPPDNISVLIPATNPTSTRSVSLKKYVLIALVAALLVIFLVILVAESLSSSRQVESPAGDIGP